MSRIDLGACSTFSASFCVGSGCLIIIVSPRLCLCLSVLFDIFPDVCADAVPSGIF